MSVLPNVIHSQSLPDDKSGKLLHFSREDVRWEWMSMTVTRLAPGRVTGRSRKVTKRHL